MRSWSSRVLDFQLKNFATKLQPAKYSIVILYLFKSNIKITFVQRYIRLMSRKSIERDMSVIKP